jgi:hypothetical protein
VGISAIGKPNNSIGITFKAHLGGVSGNGKTPLSCHHHFPTLFATLPALFRGGNVVTSRRFRLMNNPSQPAASLPLNTAKSVYSVNFGLSDLLVYDLSIMDLCTFDPFTMHGVQSTVLNSGLYILSNLTQSLSLDWVSTLFICSASWFWICFSPLPDIIFRSCSALPGQSSVNTSTNRRLQQLLIFMWLLKSQIAHTSFLLRHLMYISTTMVTK